MNIRFHIRPQTQLTDIDALSVLIKSKAREAFTFETANCVDALLLAAIESGFMIQ